MKWFDVAYTYASCAALAGMGTVMFAETRFDGQRFAAICLFWPIVIPLWVLHGLWRLFQDAGE